MSILSFIARVLVFIFSFTMCSVFCYLTCFVLFYFVCLMIRDCSRIWFVLLHLFYLVSLHVLRSHPPMCCQIIIKETIVKIRNFWSLFGILHSFRYKSLHSQICQHALQLLSFPHSVFHSGCIFMVHYAYKATTKFRKHHIHQLMNTNMCACVYLYGNFEIKRKGHFSSISPSFSCVTWSLACQQLFQDELSRNIVQHYHEREILKVLLKFVSLNGQTPSTDVDELIQSEAVGHTHWVTVFRAKQEKE